MRENYRFLLELFFSISLLLTPVICNSDEIKNKPISDKIEIIWPKPPEVARYRYLRSISGERDIIKTDGFWSSVASILFGTTEKGIQMVRPHGVAISPSGVIVVSDPGLPGIHFINLMDNSYKLVTHFKSQAIISPIGVTVTEDNNILVSDSQAKQVYIYFDNGDEIDKIDLGELKRPTGIAIHPENGRLFVVDTLAHNVVIYNLEGEQLSKLGNRGTDSGNFNYPTHLAFDAASKLYVTDSLNFRIQIFDKNLNPISRIGRLGDRVGELSKPKDVAVDQAGNIYVLDAYFDHLLIYNQSGKLLLPIGGTGQAPGLFNLPTGIAISGDTLYIVDSFNQRIQILQKISTMG